MSSVGKNAVASLLSQSQPLVIHHWDADGIASAVTVAQFVGPGVTFVMPPFTYRPSREFLDRVRLASSGKDLILIVDYNVAPEVMASIVSVARGRPVLVVDHHTAEYPKVPGLYYYNPAAAGDRQGLWPSAAHVLADALGFYDPLMIAMSIYGDLWEKALGNRVYAEYMDEVGMDVRSDSELIRDCVMQIWSAEAMRLAEVLEGLPYSLSYGGLDPCQAILSDPRMTNARVEVEGELRRAYESAARSTALEGRVALFGVRTKYKVTGMLSRRFEDEAGDKVIVVYSLEEGQGVGRIYVRGNFNVAELVARLRKRGLSAGGKEQPGNNSVALEVDPSMLESAVKVVTDELGAMLG